MIWLYIASVAITFPLLLWMAIIDSSPNSRDHRGPYQLSLTDLLWFILGALLPVINVILVFAFAATLGDQVIVWRSK